MKEGEVVLGIDPGTGRLGWAVLKVVVIDNCKKVEIVDCGLIESKANTPLVDRLELIYRELSEISQKHKPDVLVVEELFFVKNVKTGISVAHARGVVLLLGKINKMEIFQYKPNEIKMSVAGYGHATKEQMQKMIACYIKNCDIKQDDTADAIAVALTYLNRPKYTQTG
ncbi:MAG: Crossover junction endodeoxyribonuclease RuvC [candidate division WS2 bacterium ADurb.Bin280]|uniref:Crossover junction endodeoxyribonuclease RuvC n=1 Tax=candidate division WS2 bacterium ADurb.Bin280 TaxID=1852829 RepID=A0A1V5SF96_9BACT|nr:MAG: Crossover junction endodeoxyribonuclease RuvC [candidate division WS2 bacterium ADurb.Bin280]